MRDAIMKSNSNLLPGDLWFSKLDLESLGDLLTSMTQYRPSCRPTAAQILEHPWFRQEPILVPVDGPSKAEAEAAWASYKLEEFPGRDIKDSAICQSLFESFWLQMKRDKAASGG